MSREGVQRDILPIVEGSVVKTKYGNVATDHVLFIAAGAFHVSKPEDLIPELQGRFPVKVRLQSLTRADFKRILVEPSQSITSRYQALLSVDGMTIDFTDDGLDAVAGIAYDMNENEEDLGARRLTTVMEALLKELLFEAGETPDRTVTIDRAMVEETLSGLLRQHDITKYLL